MHQMYKHFHLLKDPPWTIENKFDNLDKIIPFSDALQYLFSINHSYFEIAA